MRLAHTHIGGVTYYIPMRHPEFKTYFHSTDVHYHSLILPQIRTTQNFHIISSSALHSQEHTIKHKYILYSQLKVLYAAPSYPSFITPPNFFYILLYPQALVYTKHYYICSVASPAIRCCTSSRIST